MKVIRKNIHLVGIKGVGMTPIAILLSKAGHNVQGSDVSDKFITDDVLEKLNIKVFSGFDERNIGDADLVITTGAHKGLNNVEAIAAKSRGIPVWTQGEAVGNLMKGLFLREDSYTGISISGTHGKTTTTAMLVSAMINLKLDPTYIIGTSSFNSNEYPGGFGKSKFFVAEADEYANLPGSDNTAKFIFQNPEFLVINNISFDHPDIYSTIEDVYEAFNKWLDGLEKTNLIVNPDKVDLQKIKVDSEKHRLITFGFNKDCDYYVSRSFTSLDQSFFWLKNNDDDLGEFRINLAGDHNVLNAVPGIIILKELGTTIDKIKSKIQFYKGSKRRLEFIGVSKKSKFRIYDDYAHHPDEIEATLGAFKKMYPENKIAVIFQPHTFTRTKKLLVQFSNSLYKYDYILVADIFGSARETAGGVRSSDLIDLISKHNENVAGFNSDDGLIDAIEKMNLNEGDCIVTMGAGDIYKYANILLRI